MTSDLILLFGKRGQLGSVLLKKLKDKKIKAYDYPEIDFNHPKTVGELIISLNPGLIINAAAYTAVDQAEIEKVKAFNVNGYSVESIAESAKKIGAGLIHYSTDYVFAGHQRECYIEGDLPNPINAYGESKLLGERKIIETGGFYIIFRLSWVYSRTHPSFLKQVLEWSRKYETLRIVDDQISNPTWVNMVANNTINIINRGQGDWGDYIQSNHGLYHMAGKGTVSRFEWAKTILELDPDKSIQKTKHILPAKSEDFDSLAKRPHFSGLDCTKFEKNFDIKIPEWKTSLGKALNSTSDDL